MVSNSCKQSCRACGSYLTATAVCTICQEYVAWVCNRCLKMEDVTHVHDYCRVGYGKEKTVVRLIKTD